MTAQEELTKILHDVVIVGNGVAGLSAAIYAGRYRMKTLVVGDHFGGATATAGTIWNYPGFKEIDGFDLVMKMKEQAEALGARFLDAHAERIVRSGHCFAVHVGGVSYETKTLILALGAERRHLGLPREEEFGKGRGVHYCITCDGPLYRGKTIAVVGGGDASVKGINLVAQYAKKIYLIARESQVAAEPINLEQMKKLGDRVTVLSGTEVKELIGKERLEKIKLSKPYQGSDELVLDGLFVEIGTVPNVTLARELGAQVDERGYLIVDQTMKTTVDGVFAAGDTVNFFGSFKQDITAAAMGAVAATGAYNDYKAHGDLCQWHYVPAWQVDGPAKSANY